MKKKELKQKSVRELNEILVENRQKLGQLKFELAAKKAKNVKQAKELRREIARIITLLKKQ